jgi:hypothetical protein
MEIIECTKLKMICVCVFVCACPLYNLHKRTIYWDQQGALSECFKTGLSIYYIVSTVE